MSTKPSIFEKKNYLIMLIGIVVLIVGFILMANDSESYGFGFLGLTLGPIVVFIGFLIQFVAILYNPKSNE
ncbi:MAG: DUF3098 domain-containing protein [Cyclobacteriaceae bacterium]